MYNIYMSRRRSATPRRNANNSELDGYNTEDEFPLNRSNIDIHGKWLQKERDENDRPLIRDTKSMWEIVPADLKPALLYYLTEEDGKSLGAEEQKNLIHDVVRSYHNGRHGKNNKYGHAILDEHRPCCTECVKSCVGKLCGGKTHCKECKRTLLDGAFLLSVYVGLPFRVCVVILFLICVVLWFWPMRGSLMLRRVSLALIT